MVRAIRRYYADLVIASLQDHAFASLGPQPSESSQVISSALAELPPPMLLDNEAQASSCLTAYDLKKAIVPKLSSVSAFHDCRPAWRTATTLIDVHFPRSSSRELCGDARAPASDPSALTEQKEWTFVDEGKPGRPKLGYRTLVADTSIVLEVMLFSALSLAAPCVNQGRLASKGS